MPFSNEQKRDSARREVAQRKRVYPRLIEHRRMTKVQADRETAIMQEIADDYDRLMQSERLL